MRRNARRNWNNPHTYGEGRRFRGSDGAEGGSARARAAGAVEDRPGARRRRVHGRRLRDRSAAGDRPAGDELDRERVRHLRRHQRRRLRLQPGRQRGHPRGDDAGAQQRPALADPRYRPRHAAEAQLRRLPEGLADLPVQARGRPARARESGRRGLRGRPGDRARGGPAEGHLLGTRDRALRRGGALGPGPHQRLPAPQPRALPDGDRPRHDRARDPRRGRVGRGPDLEGGRGLRRSAGDLRAGGDRRPRVHRRRHPLDHQRRRRRRARGEVHHRHQPAGPLRQRLPEEHPHDHRLACPAGVRHGHRRDRKSDLPPAVARPAAPRGRDLGRSLSGRRHHPDRAGARRRADVRDLDPRLPRPPADRQARVRVGDPQAGPRLRPLQGDRRAPRDRHLGPPGPARPGTGRPRAREALRLETGARAHQRRAAAQLALVATRNARSPRSPRMASGRSAPAVAG